MADTTQPPGATPPLDATPPSDGTIPPSGTPPREARRNSDPSNNVVQRTRAWTGLWVILVGDVAIVLAAIWGIVKTSDVSSSGASSTVAILASAFTAIGTMTTAYFGIRSATNTAHSFSPQGGATPPTATPLIAARPVEAAAPSTPPLEPRPPLEPKPPA
jgi:hypothetical protein